MIKSILNNFLPRSIHFLLPRGHVVKIIILLLLTHSMLNLTANDLTIVHNFLLSSFYDIILNKYRPLHNILVKYPPTTTYQPPIFHLL